MEIKALTQEHDTQWAELLAVCFDRTLSDMLALLEWLQSMGHIVAFGAWENNQLVAQYTSLLRQLYIQDDPILAGMSINMAVHPNFRSQGLVKQVSAPVYEEIQGCGAQLGFGFSNSEGVQVDRKSKSYQYQVLGQLQSFISYLPKRRCDALILTNDFPDSHCFRCMDSSTQNIHILKTLETMRIRYAQHPFRQYRYAVLIENGMVDGVVVYREIERLGIRGVSLLDACGHNLPHLVRRWGCTMRNRDFRFVHTLATPKAGLITQVKQQFPTMRVPYVRTPYYLTMRPLSQHLTASITHLTQWDFTGGDII